MDVTNGCMGRDLLAGFVPRLVDKGVSRPEVDAMTIDNPRRALAYDA